MPVPGSPDAFNDEAGRYSKSHLDHLPDLDVLAVLRSWLSTGSSVLDIGCGSGEVGSYLAARPATVHGLEPSAERASQAARRLPVVEVGAATPGFMPTLVTARYDHVVLIDVLEHVTDPVALLSWCAARLSEDGTILCIVPNSAHLSFRTKIVRGDWSYADAGMFDRDHVRFYDIHSIDDVTRRADMREVRRRYGPGFPRWWPLLRAQSLGRWPNLLADRLLIEWRPLAYYSSKSDRK